MSLVLLVKGTGEGGGDTAETNDENSVKTGGPIWQPIKLVWRGKS